MNKIQFLTLIFATIGCRDASKLVGDSNVYLNIDMAFHNIDYESAEAEETSVLTASVVDGFLQVNHDNLPFPCGHDVEEHAFAEWKDDFSIFIDYQPERTESAEKCPVNLVFTLDVVAAELPPGVYTVACVNDEDRCDLTQLLE